MKQELDSKLVKVFPLLYDDSNEMCIIKIEKVD